MIHPRDQSITVRSEISVVRGSDLRPSHGMLPSYCTRASGCQRSYPNKTATLENSNDDRPTRSLRMVTRHDRFCVGHQYHGSAGRSRGRVFHYATFKLRCYFQKSCDSDRDVRADRTSDVWVCTSVYSTLLNQSGTKRKGWPLREAAKRHP